MEVMCRDYILLTVFLLETAILMVVDGSEPAHEDNSISRASEAVHRRITSSLVLSVVLVVVIIAPPDIENYLSLIAHLQERKSYFPVLLLFQSLSAVFLDSYL